jgi:hypothetical protein
VVTVVMQRSRVATPFAATILLAVSARDRGSGQQDGDITIPTSDASHPELSLGAGAAAARPNVSVNKGGDATLARQTKSGALNLLATGKDPESRIRDLEIWMETTTTSSASANICTTSGPGLLGAPRFDSTEPPKQPGEKTSASSLRLKLYNSVARFHKEHMREERSRSGGTSMLRVATPRRNVADADNRGSAQRA